MVIVKGNLFFFVLLFTAIFFFACGSGSEKEKKEVVEVELKSQADSSWKKLEKILSGYDSVGVDTLGRTIYMHKNDSRNLK